MSHGPEGAQRGSADQLRLEVEGQPLRPDVRGQDPQTPSSMACASTLSGVGIWTRCTSAFTARCVSSAGRGPRRRGAGVLHHEDSGQSGRTEVHEEADEAARLRQDHHHRWVALLPRSHERARHRGPAGGQPLGNYRVENSHQPFRRRERAMPRFRRMKTLQQFASTHSAFHNYFNQERHLVSREIYRERRLAALAEWRQVVG